MGEVKKAKKIRVEEEQKELEAKKSIYLKIFFILLYLSIFILLVYKIIGLLNNHDGKKNITTDEVVNNYTDEECFITDGTIIIGYDLSCGKHVKIPRIINGLKITEIGERAFSEMGIKSVEFPDTLKKIGKYSFERNKLTEVIIPDSVTKIYAGAFEQNKIRKVVFGENVNLIGSWAFDFNDLIEVEIPDSVKTVNQEAFANNSLIKVIIGRNVQTIGYSAFGQYDWRNNFIKEDSDQNRNLSLIINKSGRSFDWYDVLGHDSYVDGPELWLISGKVDTKFGTVTIKEQ